MTASRGVSAPVVGDQSAAHRVLRFCLVFVPMLALAALQLPQAAPQATPVAEFYAIGDLVNPLGGDPFSSAVRDATSVNGTLYAVGSGGVNGTGGVDMPLLWTFDGTTASLVALPNIAIVPPATSNNFAFAITPDGHYIASQERAGATTMNAVRVTNNNGVLTNLNLSSILPGFSARAISDFGSVLYGLRQNASNLAQAVRWQVSPTSSGNLVDLLPGTTTSFPAHGGTSADGAVMVGTALTPPQSLSATRAFRYVHNALPPVTAIPTPAGGTWGTAVDVSANGNLSLVVGNSTAFPNGEYYLHDAAAGTITSLGSPNSAFAPVLGAGNTLYGGMTADGDVVVGSMAGSGFAHAYVHNSHGWFPLASVFEAYGIDLPARGWLSRGFLVSGVRTIDGKDLIFGRGTHLTNFEGFVGVLPAGALASFDVPAVAPANTSIVGTWSYQDPNNASLKGVLALMQDGTYYQVAANGTAGFERGRYSWNAATGAFVTTTIQDTNGLVGLSDFDGSFNLSLAVSGSTATLTVDPTDPTLPFSAFPTSLPLNRLDAQPGSLVGGWSNGSAITGDTSSVLVLLGDGTYYFARDGVAAGGGRDGVEVGTYTWDSFSAAFAATAATDTNGTWGPANLVATAHAGLSIDEIILNVSDINGNVPYRRIVATADVLPVITSLLTAEATEGDPFSYTITANHAAHFGATGLPPGLTISNGVISGTPTTNGIYTVTISATNSFGSTVSASLLLKVTPASRTVEIDWPTPAGITYGSPLSGAHLHATAAVAGTFAYMPAAGTVLSAGLHQALTVVFTPTDQSRYDIATKTVFIDVAKKAASVTPASYSKTYGGADIDINPPSGGGTLVGFEPADLITATYARDYGAGGPGPGEHAGTYAITATLSPQGRLANYDIDDSQTGTFTINRAPLILTATANWTYAMGQLPAFDVHYSGLVNGESGPNVVDVTVTTSADQLTVVGQYPVFIEVTGSSGNYHITQGPSLLIIHPAPIGVSVDASKYTVGRNKPVTLKATVYLHDGFEHPCVSACPVGMVTFFDNGVPVGPAVGVSQASTAEFPNFMSDQSGPHHISAQYAPSSPNFAAETNSTILTITVRGLVDTVTTIDPALAPTYYFGQTFSVSAAVVVDPLVIGFDGVLDGQVEFSDTVAGVTTVLGTRGLVNGRATISWMDSGVAWSAETHKFSARYLGNAELKTSNSTKTPVEIQKLLTTTSVDAQPAPYRYGEVFTVTALVVLQPFQLTVFAQPCGWVDFYDTFGGVTTTLGRRGLVPGGRATISWLDQGTPWAAGNHKIQAKYVPGSCGGGSSVGMDNSQSEKITFDIDKLATTASVDGPMGSYAYGQVFTVTARVILDPMQNTTITQAFGTIEFSDTFGGVTTVLGTRGVVNGQATISWLDLGVPWARGVHKIQAKFVASGQGSFATSTSTKELFEIVKATTSTTIEVTPSSISSQGTLSLTVRVTPSHPGLGVIPDGTVTVTLSTGQSFDLQLFGGEARYAYPTLPDGTYWPSGTLKFQAKYNGSNNFASSPNSAKVTVFVGSAPN